jgi:integrase
MSRRTTLAPGIYQDAYGYSVIAKVGTYPNQVTSPEIRFPPDTPLPTMVARWHREKMRLTDERAKAGDGPVARGTLAADVRRYLDTARLSPQRQAERADQLQWWCESFGTKRRAELEAPDLRRALNGLERGGRDGKTPMAASTVNKYRFALSHVFTVLDGQGAANPLRDVPKYQEPEPEARDIPYEIIDRIIDAIRDRGQRLSLSRTKAIVRVLAYVSVTPAQLRRMRRTDVFLHAGTFGELVTPGRQKGRGTKAKRKPLVSEKGREALQAAEAAGCWTDDDTFVQFSRASLYRTFTDARDRVVAQLRVERPDLDLSRVEQMRPYDLRHSFATVASIVLNGNEALVGEFLDHQDPRTTKRYTRGALSEHLRTAGDAIAVAFATPQHPAIALPPKPAAVPVVPATAPRLRKARHAD